MLQRVERAGAHRRGGAGGPKSRCREGGAGVMAEGAKTAAARADGGLRQSGRRRWRWRWPKAVVPRGGAAAWWGRQVGSTERGLGCGWLRTRWRPVTRGRDVVIEAIAAFVGAPPAPPAPPFLQPGPAARAAAPQRPVNAGEEDGVTHVLGYVWLGWAGEQRGQGRGSIPASSPVKDIVRKMDRAAVAAAPTACHCCSDSRSGTFIEFIERVELLRV